MPIPPKLRSWIDKYARTAGFGVALALGACFLLLPGRYTTRWAALALVLIAGAEFGRRVRPQAVAWLTRRRPERLAGLSHWLPALIVTLLTLWLLGPIAIGQMPASQDHASHYLATDILVRNLIGSGRLFGIPHPSSSSVALYACAWHSACIDSASAQGGLAALRQA